MYYQKVFIASTVLAILSCAITVTPLSAETDSTTQINPISQTIQKNKTVTEERPPKVATKTQEIREKIATREATIKEKIQEQKDMIATKAGQKWENRCDMLNKKTQEKIERYEKNKQNHLEDYKQVKNRLQTTITNLKAEGHDVTVLEANLKQLDTLIKKASEDYAKFITALKKTNDFACGKSEGAYALALKSAQVELITARQSMMAIREYYKNTVRPNILAIRQQKASPSPTQTAKSAASPTTNQMATTRPTTTPHTTTQ